MTGSTRTQANGNSNSNGQVKKDEEQQPEAESSDGTVRAVTATEGEGEGTDVGAGAAGAGGVGGAEGAGGGEDNGGAASGGAAAAGGDGEDGTGVTAGAAEGGEAASVSAPATANGNQNGSNTGQNDVQNANQVATVPNGGTSPTARPNGVSNGTEQLIHNPGIAMDWTAEEQSILDEGLVTFAGESSSMWRYIKIAKLLPEKTVRDVAMRVRWMTKKEMGKRRKPEDQNTNKKNKEKKDKSDGATNKTPQNHGRPGVPTYLSPPLPDNDDGISNDAIGGETGQLLEQNQQLFAQIRANFAACKLNDNCDLLTRCKDNIVAILNGMTNMPGIMSQMPPLPVKIDTDLAEEIFRLKNPLQSPSAS